MGTLLESMRGLASRISETDNFIGNDASDALDEEIANHLQEIGAGTAIPIREEKPIELEIPVSLKSPGFELLSDKIRVLFASSKKGKLIIKQNNKEKLIKFGVEDNGVVEIDKFNGNLELFFHFAVQNGVSLRKYTYSFKGNNEPIILEDKITSNGEEFIISKIFGQDEEDSKFNKEGFCLICYNAAANVVALPCRHCAMCSSCSKRFAALSTNCPVCRQKVKELIEMKE